MITSIFLWALCGYIWVNILTLSPSRAEFFVGIGCVLLKLQVAGTIAVLSSMMWHSPCRGTWYHGAVRDDQLELRQLPTIYTGLSSRAHKMDNVGLTIRNVSLTCWLLLYSTSNTREGDIRGQCDRFFMVRWPVNCIFLSWFGDDLRRARSFSLNFLSLPDVGISITGQLNCLCRLPFNYIYLFYILWFYIYYYILAYGHHYLSVTISLSIAQVILAYFIMLLQCYRLVSTIYHLC